jgi:hypothetical protein
MYKQINEHQFWGIRTNQKLTYKISLFHLAVDTSRKRLVYLGNVIKVN